MSESIGLRLKTVFSQAGQDSNNPVAISIPSISTMTNNSSITNHNYADDDFANYDSNEIPTLLTTPVRNDDTEPIIGGDRLTSVSSVIDVNGRTTTEAPRSQSTFYVNNDRTPLLRQIR